MRNPSTLPRKQPRQPRSRATVEVILEAAARVLVQEGFEAATTNRIAQVAGVSIGSLYQYFPNKEALVRALLERHMADANSTRPPELDDGSRPLRERIRIAVDWFLRMHALDPALHQVLTVHAPRLLGVDSVVALERLLQARLREVLAPERDRIRPRNLDIAAFLMAQSLESLTHGAVLHHPELLDSNELADEMTEMIAGYLER